MNFHIRSIREPDDFEQIAVLVNTIWSEPTTGKQLQEVEDKIPPGQLHYDEEGRLNGWDRPKWVAEDRAGRVIGYALAWRAPWTEPGTLYQVLVVQPDLRGKGVGTALFETMLQWAKEVGASRLIDSMKESDEASLSFARRSGYGMERHMFESVLDLASFDGKELYGAVAKAEQAGIRFTTLAEEPGEANERLLYELYKKTHVDIPGYNDGYPPFHEWKKWSIAPPSVRPEWIHIAKDGERYVGVVTLQHNETTNAMYNEYTGVLAEYRGRRIALALKLLGIETARACGAPYLKTHNDSLNDPMLRINRDIIGFRAEPGQYKMVRELM
jgi:GNAT superfamily N-acetyltransferase